MKKREDVEEGQWKGRKKRLEGLAIPQVQLKYLFLYVNIVIV